MSSASGTLKGSGLPMPTESRRRTALALQGVFGRSYRVPESWDEGLSSEDAALAQAILGLCLRHWGRLDAWIRPRLKTPNRGLPIGSHTAIAMGLAQLAWLPGVLTHAAVNESVLLAADPALGFPAHKGLANALLRQASKDRETLKAELEALPASLDRSPFVEQALRAALAPHGAEDQLEELWRLVQRLPRPCFRSLQNESIPEGMEADPVFPAALRLMPEAVFPRDWLRSGAGMVQDLSSQALMTFAWDGEPPQTILDACAAPGGKTTALARRWPQAKLLALEADARRAKRLQENLSARRVNAQVEVAEAVSRLRDKDDRFDLILLDAPCSGSGTLRKNPELTWIGDRLDLERLIRNQRALLEAAIPRLSPGGLLVYAVCSWLPQEGDAHRTAILKTHPELRPEELWPVDLGNQGVSATFFRPDPLAWDGEGFQAFGFRKQ